VTLDLDANGIDEDDAAQARRVSHGEFRRDPATYRESNNHDLVEVKPFEEFEIGESKIIDAVEPLRPWLTRKAGVDRREHVCMFRDCRNEARHALRSATTVQDKERATAPSLVDAHRQAVGEGLYSGLRRKRGERTHVINPFFSCLLAQAT